MWKLKTVLPLIGLLLFTASHCQCRELNLTLDYKTAEQLAALPLECYNKEFPYKSSIVMNGTQDVQVPKYHHPIFYGCFDWHSSVHGHWLLAAILARFPDTALASKIIPVFDEQFQLRKAEQEIVYLKTDKAYERTYGWSWFLKLHQELKALGKIDESHSWSANLQLIADHFLSSYMSFLPKLIYPVRVGEHTNSAFGLIFPYEYAKDIGDEELIDLIVSNVTSHYGSDQGCPLNWEPSGTDFLSPCLQEADLLGRISSKGHLSDFSGWFKKFLPQFQDEKFTLEPGKVHDRTDGKLVHLDGLNFSRAYNLYSLIINLNSTDPQDIKLKERMMKMADDHILESIEHVVGSDYAGSHWLATFLTYAIQKREEAIKALSGN